MIKGITINLGGTDYVVPPLSLGALERFEDALAAFDGMATLTRENVALVIDVAFAALKRNYPAITREDVADLVDLSNFGEVFGAVMNASAVIGGSDKPGEPAAA